MAGTSPAKTRRDRRGGASNTCAHRRAWTRHLIMAEGQSIGITLRRLQPLDFRLELKAQLRAFFVG